MTASARGLPAWDVAAHLRSGRLVPVLPHWATPEADIHAVWPQRLLLSPRVRALVDFLAASFGQAPLADAASVSRTKAVKARTRADT